MGSTRTALGEQVQIIGDGNGGAVHLWERDCSVQRRYQKVLIVEPVVVSSGDQVASALRRGYDGG